MATGKVRPDPRVVRRRSRSRVTIATATANGEERSISPQSAVRRHRLQSICWA